ncbi:GTP-binding protein 1 [Chytriomyces hyalinus]|nr:GTP-binding protein 1 [Chytriomyces hyalinus]
MTSIASKTTTPTATTDTHKRMDLKTSAAASLAHALMSNNIGDGDSDDDDEENLAAFADLHLSSKSLYISQTPAQVTKLATLLSSRIEMGQGEAVLELGVEDDGSSMKLTRVEYDEALMNLRKCCIGLNCDVSVLHERRDLKMVLSNNLATGVSGSNESVAEEANVPSATVRPYKPASTFRILLNLVFFATPQKAQSPATSPVSPNTGGPSPTTKETGSLDAPSDKFVASKSEDGYFYAHLLIRKHAGQVEDLNELRIAVVGNVDAGKSTLLGVLTKNVLDDGRGKARINLFKHKHEIESGRTSSVGLEIMGFTSKGNAVTTDLVNGAGSKQKLTWDDICANASKVISFFDLAGHEKYLKTTVFGMTGCSPDFVMLMIGANAGIIGMTKEHLGLALALNVPVYICITKIDMCPPNVLENTIKQLTKILKSSGCRKIPMFIKTEGDVLVTAGNFVSERVCPIFQVSNLTGEGLDLLKLFLNVLRSNSQGHYNPKAGVEYQITDTFSVPGVGTVVNGTLVNGIVHVGDSLLIGPDSSGHFTPTIVKSIQRKRVNVPVASAGQSASFALKKIKRSSIRKGMVMVSKAADAKAYYEFEAEILVLYHSTTISTRYQAMLHCGGVRQTAKIVGMDKGVLRTGDRALVQFRFMRNPEYLKIGTRLLFREGRTKGVGKVVYLGPKDTQEASK